VETRVRFPFGVPSRSDGPRVLPTPSDRSPTDTTDWTQVAEYASDAAPVTSRWDALSDAASNAASRKAVLDRLGIPPVRKNYDQLAKVAEARGIELPPLRRSGPSRGRKYRLRLVADPEPEDVLAGIGG